MAPEQDQEKLAAAKKRVEQLKKQKAKKEGNKKKDADSGASAERRGIPKTPSKGSGPEDGLSIETERSAAGDRTADDLDARDNGESKAPKPQSTPKTPSTLSLESRMRSSSFRQGNPLSPSIKSPTMPPLSPDGESASDIYRKQALRIDELEKENKRLERDFRESENRKAKMEEDLEELRASQAELTALKERAQKAEGKGEEFETLKSEIASLQRRNAQLQAQTAKSRHASSPSVSLPPPSDLQSALESKSATIEAMELEISNLRARLSTSTDSNSQIAALEAQLSTSHAAASQAQQDLAALRKNLERASDRAVKDSSLLSAAETKIRALERELSDSQTASKGHSERATTLEAKMKTLATLHKDSDARSQLRQRERDQFERDNKALSGKLAHVEGQLQKLRDEKDAFRRGTDDDAVDELEDEERKQLTKRVRELEAELHEVRRSVYHDRRRELAGPMGLLNGEGAVLEGGEPGPAFTDVDLNSSVGPKSPVRGFSTVLGQGINLLTGVTSQSSQPSHQVASGADGLDADLDDDFAFDEAAFRQAQEDEARRRVERVRELKRGLREWEGWRMDLTEQRRGGGGVGEIFDV